MKLLPESFDLFSEFLITHNGLKISL